MSATSSGIGGTEIPLVFMEVLTNLLNKTCLDKVRRVGDGRLIWCRNVVLIVA